MNSRQKGVVVLLVVGMLLVWGVVSLVVWWGGISAASPGTSPTVLPTSTATSALTPTWPSPWTSTPLPTAADTPTARPTSTITPTRTPTRRPLPTPTLTPVATSTPLSSDCDCSGDRYDCDDFPSQAAAQACYNHCKAPGYGDIHHLDSDGDGIACEGLPNCREQKGG